MSLLRLLRAGKSLVGAGEASGRYRLLNGPALPKFGSDKNPFREPARTKGTPVTEVGATAGSLPDNSTTPDLPIAATAQQETATTCQEPPMKAVEQKPAIEKVKKEKQVIARRAVFETKPNSEISSAAPQTNAEAVKPTSVVAAGARAAARVLRLNSKLNPLFGWARPRGGARALPRTDAMVQGELSLDRVKVVRNDLSDSDLEIVPAKKPTPKPVPAPELAAAAASSPQRPWERVASRLFGAGKT